MDSKVLQVNLLAEMTFVKPCRINHNSNAPVFIAYIVPDRIMPDRKSILPEKRPAAGFFR